MIKKFKINHAVPVSMPQNIPTFPSSSAATSKTTSLSPLLKRHLSIECLNTPTGSLKKIRENLIQKHAPIPVVSSDPITDEIEDYLKLDVSCDDVLQFWRSSKDTFPHLKRLSQVILAIPATSTPSEKVFSITGLIVNAKRTMLAPENIGKIQVIHDNYDLLKNV
jgi:hypothetical protein